MTSSSERVEDALTRRARLVRKVSTKLAQEIVNDADLLFTFSFYIADTHDHLQAGTTPRICTAVIPFDSLGELQVMVPPQNDGVKEFFKQQERSSLRAALTVQLYGYDDADVYTFESTGVTEFPEKLTKYSAKMDFLDTTTRPNDSSEPLLPANKFTVTLRFDTAFGCAFKTATFSWKSNQHQNLADLLRKEAEAAQTREMLSVTTKLARTIKDEEWSDDE